jgi:hypothetical protein
MRKGLEALTMHDESVNLVQGVEIRPKMSGPARLDLLSEKTQEGLAALVENMRWVRELDVFAADRSTVACLAIHPVFKNFNKAATSLRIYD